MSLLLLFNQPAEVGPPPQAAGGGGVIHRFVTVNPRLAPLIPVQPKPKPIDDEDEALLLVLALL